MIKLLFDADILLNNYIVIKNITKNNDFNPENLIKEYSFENTAEKIYKIIDFL